MPNLVRAATFACLCFSIFCCILFAVEISKPKKCKIVKALKSLKLQLQLQLQLTANSGI